jgi:hypothetical protein
MPFSQDDLRHFWHSSAPDRLSPWQQAFALGLREASKEIHEGHVYVNWIASKLRKTDGTGKAYSEDAPSHGSVSVLLKQIGDDPTWFPGKHSGRKRGPNIVLSPHKRARIAWSAMLQKSEGHEPGVTETILRCPAATLNPKTSEPFCDKTIRKVFLEDCYDFTPDSPWKLQLALQKNMLPEDIKEHRFVMSRHITEVRDHGTNVHWWARNVVWIDPCASVLPRSRRQYDRMRHAEIGDKRQYISDDARLYSRNLRGPKESLKQAGFEAMRISWIIVLARGRVGIEMLPAGWTVDGAGMAEAVQMLPRILRSMLGPDVCLPRVLFTDRGTGMYAPTGQVVHAYADAVDAAGFRLYWGADAKQQAPDMGDMLLHETAVAWFRARMKRERPAVLPWEETRAQWNARKDR